MNNFFSEHLLPCAYKSLFGIDCPICGFQRAFLLLVQGDFMGSIKMYAPLIPILTLLIVALLRKVKPNFIGKTILSYYSLLVLIIVIINYTVKMIM
ncbi:MAG: DUF2752 domain-containing protein [Ginsengibacter sp.]